MIATHGNLANRPMESGLIKCTTFGGPIYLRSYPLPNSVYLSWSPFDFSLGLSDENLTKLIQHASIPQEDKMKIFNLQNLGIPVVQDVSLSVTRRFPHGYRLLLNECITCISLFLTDIGIPVGDSLLSVGL